MLYLGHRLIFNVWHTDRNCSYIFTTQTFPLLLCQCVRCLTLISFDASLIPMLWILSLRIIILQWKATQLNLKWSECNNLHDFTTYLLKLQIIQLNISHYLQSQSWAQLFAAIQTSRYFRYFQVHRTAGNASPLLIPLTWSDWALWKIIIVTHWKQGTEQHC